MIGALLFDMDGLLLDTEPLWGTSMLKVAAENGVPITPDFFKQTTGLRITEVTEYWSRTRPWTSGISSYQMAQDILDDIIALSKKEARVMPGALQLINLAKQNNIKISVATSSPERMVHALLDHFKISHFFDAITSADKVDIGKPHPAVFLQSAQELNVLPSQCVVLEDSINGMIAGLAARMKVIVVPDESHFNKKGFSLAHKKYRSLEEITLEDLKYLSTF